MGIDRDDGSNRRANAVLSGAKTAGRGGQMRSKSTRDRGFWQNGPFGPLYQPAGGKPGRRTPSGSGWFRFPISLAGIVNFFK